MVINLKCILIDLQKETEEKGNRGESKPGHVHFLPTSRQTPALSLHNTDVH